MRGRNCCITWVSAARFAAARWPMRTSSATGASTPTLAQQLIRRARRLYADEPLAIGSGRDGLRPGFHDDRLVPEVFPWARFRRTKAAIKLHTLLDLRGPIPTFVHISDGKLHDVNALDELPIEAGSFYVMDRGYLDFARLYVLASTGRLLRHSRQAIVCATRGCILCPWMTPPACAPTRSSD